MRGARILVVDDELDCREVLARLLASRGLHVATASDGPSAIEWLEHNPADLVLLDVSMPEMSGLDVLKWIRGREETALLPVILVSALADSDAVIAGLEAGANDYVTKPLNPPVLMARITAGLARKRGLDRLLEAERNRHKLQALSDASETLARPLAAIVKALKELEAQMPASPQGVRGRLEDIRAGAKDAEERLAKLRRLAAYRTEPYTAGLGSLIEAALEEAKRAEPRSTDES